MSCNTVYSCDCCKKIIDKKREQIFTRKGDSYISDVWYYRRLCGPIMILVERKEYFLCKKCFSYYKIACANFMSSFIEIRKKIKQEQKDAMLIAREEKAE